eukprot:CAMPEP_0202692614 /NCGR_PEP_ID=MMETSP1385-20130828/6943_1 /ASSEMBLY_ACC=CAM_ASM_000861 /TAXON_ID=933848 /ORGANISM="Elphidium margaritaceum" /LENGTH=529 /DNA_ID=CAMNT_0049348177 /DNA_START=37 /DNA_END=1626 /DNA_ORIENTATION=-
MQRLNRVSARLSTIRKSSFGTNATASTSSHPWKDYISQAPKHDPIHRLLKDKAYINGQWSDALDKQTFDVLDPASNEIITSLPDMGAAETNDAIETAYESLTAWQSFTCHARAEIVNKIYVLMNVYQEQLARIITAECGKPLAEARGEVMFSASFFKWFAEEGRRLNGDVIATNKSDRRLLVIKEPVGVCGIITPWNFPAAMIARKLAPALVTGCSAVIKPPHLAPLSALALAEICEEAGVLPGVVNVLSSDKNMRQIGAEICENKLVRKLSFTGSTAAGMTLAQQSANTLKRVSMELGGNAPFIVFADADVDAAVQGAMVSKYRNAGQTCVCTNRFYIHSAVYDEFVDKYAQQVRKLKIGHGFGDGVQIGPLISKQGADKVQRHVDDAKRQGAEIICGGRETRVEGLAGDTFFEPTIVSKVTPDMQMYQEETFGPLSGIVSFDDDEQVVSAANDTDMGLAAYFYTKDLSRAFRVSEQLEYGMVGVNSGLISTEIAPFGGVKYSGMGREGSKYGIDEYVQLKYICMENV